MPYYDRIEECTILHIVLPGSLIITSLSLFNDRFLVMHAQRVIVCHGPRVLVRTNMTSFVRRYRCPETETKGRAYSATSASPAFTAQVINASAAKQQY